MFFVTILVVVGLSSCSDGGTTSGGSPQEPVSVQGVVQKGPFILGSVVTVYQLDSQFERTAVIVSSTISDNEGHYSITVPWQGLSEVVITGYYFDETKGVQSQDEATLSTIVEIFDGGVTPPNVNIFTHLAALRIKALMKEGATLAEAKQTSAGEIMSLFGYLNTEGLDFGRLDLTELFGDNATVNAELLRLSAALLQSDQPLEDLERLIVIYNEGGIDAVMASAIFARIQQNRYLVDMDATTDALEINASAFQHYIASQAVITKLMTSSTLHLQLNATTFISTNPTITLLADEQELVSIESIDIADDNHSAEITLTGATNGCTDISLRLRLSSNDLNNVTSDLYSNVLNLRDPLTLCQTDTDGETYLELPANQAPIAIIGTRSDLDDQENRQIITYVGAVVRGLETFYSYDVEHYPLGSIVHCQWQDENGLVISSSNNSVCDLTDKVFLEAGNYDYTLTVTDNMGATGSNVAHIEVRPNRVPEVVLTPTSLADIMMGEGVSITATATDADGDALYYLWTYREEGSSFEQWESMNEHFEHTFTQAGYYIITLNVLDEHSALTSIELPLHVVDTNPFRFTDYVGIEIQEFPSSTISVDWLAEGEQVAISSSGYEENPTYSGVRVNGTTLTQVKNGDIVTVWHKTSNQYGVTLNTTVTIGAYSDTFSTTTKMSSNDKLPLIVGAPKSSANRNTDYTYTPQLSTDYERFAPVTKPFTIENRPYWATFDPETGTLSGVPRVVGVYKDVSITAYGDAGIDVIRFDITVRNDGPYISAYDLSLDDANLLLNFDENSDWRANVVEVQMSACYSADLVTLSEHDYTFSEGHLTLHSSSSENVVLHTPIMGGGQLLVKSIGYGDAYGFIDYVQDGQYGVKATLVPSTTPVSESNLNSVSFELTLSNTLAFNNNILDVENFTLYEAPEGTTVSSVTYISPTQATIRLSFDGTDFDEMKSLRLNISAAELNSCQNIETASIDVEAYIEIVWSDFIYPPTVVEFQKFGGHIDIYNETVAVSATDHVYIYVKAENGRYALRQTIDIANNDVALDGAYLVIADSSYSYDESSNITRKSLAGRIYIYKKDASGLYAQISTVAPIDVASVDHFGSSIDISGNLIIVGAYNADHHRGLAYIVENNGADYFRVVEKLRRENGKQQDGFGYSVAIDGAYFVVGSWVQKSYLNGEVDDKLELGAGFANYYSYFNHKVTLMNVLSANDTTELSSAFGRNVAISGDIIAVSATGADGNRGAIYQFSRAFNTAIFDQKISGDATGDSFGFDMDLYGETLVAITLDGRAYKVKLQGRSHTKTVLEYNDPVQVARSCKIDHNDIVLGASLNNDQATNSGAILMVNAKETITSDDDGYPAGLTFENYKDVALSTLQKDDILVTGLNREVSLRIENGMYSLDYGVSWSDEDRSITNNQVIYVRHTSADTYETTVITRLYVGDSYATFSSTTKPENYAPQALDKEVAIQTDSLSNYIYLQSRDIDSTGLNYTVVSDVSHGTLTGNAPYLYYTPNADYIGEDSLTFKVNDGTSDSQVATVTFVVNKIVYVGRSYGTVVSPYTDKIWLDRNIGAERVCVDTGDTLCYGDYFQWGRQMDGHQKLSSYTRDYEENVALEGAGVSYRMGQSPLYDWSTGVDDDGTLRSEHWSLLDAGSVCPANFRVPTASELEAEVAGAQTAYFLHLPLSGYRSHTGVYLTQESGYLWSSTPNESRTMTLSKSPSTIAVNTTGRHREDGVGVRCITDMPNANPINVLKTGVTTSHVTGDDGHYQKGQDHQYSRDAESGIVTDHTTGLQWYDKAVVDYYIYSTWGSGQAQDRARVFCAAKEAGGYDDWRLASVEELLTLVDYSKTPKHDPIFENIALSEQNTSRTYISTTEHGGPWAWLVNFDTGNHGYHSDDSHDNLLCVRGAPLVTSQFYRFENDTVRDFSTNLVWQDANREIKESITDAIDYCSTLGLGGITDWRLPNINELISIKDFSKESGESISDVFTDTYGWRYYTSTPNTEATGYYAIWFSDGGNSVDGSDLNTSHYVRCVSGENRYVEMP